MLHISSIVLSNLNCQTVKHFYSHTQLSTGESSCCDSNHGSINVDSCVAHKDHVAHKDDLKALARIQTYHMQEYWNLTQTGVDDWIFQDNASYTASGRPPVGTIGTQYDFRIAPFGQGRETPSPNVDRKQLLKVSGAWDFSYNRNAGVFMSQPHNVAKRAHMKKESTFDARTDLIYTHPEFHNGFDPFDHLLVHDAHNWEYSLAAHKDFGGAPQIISTTKTYADSIVEFTVQFTETFRPVYRERFHFEGKDWPELQFKFHSVIDNTDRTTTGMTYADLNVPLGIYKNAHMRLPTNGGAFGKLSSDKSGIDNPNERPWEFLTFLLNEDPEYYPGRRFGNFDPFKLTFMLKGTKMSMKVNDQTVLFGKEIGTEAGVNVTAIPEIGMNVGYLHFIPMSYPFKISNMTVKPLTDSTWNGHVSSVTTDYNYNAPRTPVYMWRANSTSLGLVDKADTPVYKYQLESLGKNTSELLNDEMIFQTASVPYWIYDFCTQGKGFCNWYDSQPGRAYTLEAGALKGVGWAAQSVADWMKGAGTSLVHRPPLITQAGIDYMKSGLDASIKAKIAADTLANIQVGDPVPEPFYVNECYTIGEYSPNGFYKDSDGNPVTNKPSVEACVRRNVYDRFYWTPNGLYKD